MAGSEPLIFISDEELKEMIGRALERCDPPKTDPEQFATAMRDVLHRGSLSIALQFSGSKSDHDFAHEMLHEIRSWLRRDPAIEQREDVRTRFTHLTITLRIGV